MKKQVLISIILMIVLSLAGCFKTVYPWSLAIPNSYVTSVVYSTYGTPYFADPGYKWRVLNVSITNNLNYTQRLNPLIYKIQVRPEGTNLYFDNQLIYSNIVNELDWSDVQPHQTVTGEVYIELPDIYAYSPLTVWLIDTLADGSGAICTTIDSGY